MVISSKISFNIKKIYIDYNSIHLNIVKYISDLVLNIESHTNDTGSIYLSKDLKKLLLSKTDIETYIRVCFSNIFKRNINTLTTVKIKDSKLDNSTIKCIKAISDLYKDVKNSLSSSKFNDNLNLNDSYYNNANINIELNLLHQSHNEFTTPLSNSFISINSSKLINITSISISLSQESKLFLDNFPNLIKLKIKLLLIKSLSAIDANIITNIKELEISIHDNNSNSYKIDNNLVINKFFDFTTKYLCQLENISIKSYSDKSTIIGINNIIDLYLPIKESYFFNVLLKCLLIISGYYKNTDRFLDKNLIIYEKENENIDDDEIENSSNTKISTTTDDESEMQILSIISYFKIHLSSISLYSNTEFYVSITKNLKQSSIKGNSKDYRLLQIKNLIKDLLLQNTTKLIIILDSKDNMRYEEFELPINLSELKLKIYNQPNLILSILNKKTLSNAFTSLNKLTLEMSKNIFNHIDFSILSNFLQLRYFYIKAYDSRIDTNKQINSFLSQKSKAIPDSSGSSNYSNSMNSFCAKLMDFIIIISKMDDFLQNLYAIQLNFINCSRNNNICIDNQKMNQININGKGCVGIVSEDIKCYLTNKNFNFESSIRDICSKLSNCYFFEIN